MSGLSEPRLLGAVLAGGESRRFGKDKAWESLGGEPLAIRAAKTLAAVFEEVIIVSSRAAGGIDPWLCVPDLRPGCGPLGGLEASLVHAGREQWDGVFLLACDLPLVTAELVSMIASGLGPADAAVAVRKGATHHEPLCGAYRGGCLGEVQRLLDRNELAVMDVVRGVRAVFVEAESTAFLNVNTPSDRERAEAVLLSGGRPSAGRRHS